MKAAAYIRESSIEQADGYSPDMQLRAIRKYAQEHGMTLDERHIFQEFQSGRTDQRERFQDLLKEAENHEFDAVLLYHTSRFARNIADARRYKRHLRERLGIKVVSVTQAIDPSTPSGRLAEGVFELFDDNYSDQLGAWVKAGYQEKWERGGLLGNLPIGYTYELAQDGKTKRIVPDKVLAPMIRQGFELYATGECSYKTLATWANSQGYRTMKGLPFNLFSWEVILNNPTYAGWVSYHRRREPKKHDLKPS